MRKKIFLIGLFLTVIFEIQAADFRVTSFGDNGDLTWEDTNTNGTYTVQWCSSLALTNWSSAWTGLTQVAATGGAIRVNVPMFYRVIHRPRQSQSANMRLVSGGGQPQGPQYDFYAAKFEVTTEEFCEFLNDAQANPGNERGSNMFFNEQGDVYMDSAANMTEVHFKIMSSRLLYNNAAREQGQAISRG
jgi:hypothetical protein